MLDFVKEPAVTRSKSRTSGAEIYSLTKYRRGQLPASRTRTAPPFKAYANPKEVAALPAPQLRGGAGMWRTLAAERGGPAEGGQLKQEHLSQLLWSCLGFTFGRERMHATAQEVSSLEGYLLSFRAQDLFSGVYHYNPREHSLYQLSTSDPAEPFQECLLDPLEVEAQAAVICFTGLPMRHRVIDGGRAYRYLLLDAGAAAQNVMLAASALGLAATFLTDFYDDELSSLLNLDGRGEWPLCLVAIGS